MSTQRYISTSFWNDPWVLDECTSDERYVYLYLLTSPNSNIAGIYELSLRTAELHTGYDREQLKRILDRFAEAHKAYYYQGYVIIPKWPTHQKWDARSKIKAGIENVLKALPKAVLAEAKRVEYEFPISDDTLYIPYQYESSYSDSDLDLDTDSDTDDTPAQNNKKHTADTHYEIDDYKLPINSTRYDRLKEEYGEKVVNDYIGRAYRYSLKRRGDAKQYKDYTAAAEDYMRRDKVPKRQRESKAKIDVRNLAGAPRYD